MNNRSDSMAFTFKQFHIDDHNCGMPVSTDAVILGAWAPLTRAQNVLDIGAGSGLLSLMAAQRSAATITAIELDETAASACERNFKASNWGERLVIEECAIQDFAQQRLNTQIKFDHIICNPPYFKGGTQSKNQLRAKARHTDTLDFSCLIKAMTRLLAVDGTASLILPSQSMPCFLEELTQSELTMTRVMDIADSAAKKPHRHVFTLAHRQSLPHEPSNRVESSHFCIKESDGSYSQEMIGLITGFYLKY
ncbi:conserved hypothetical protein [Shewanella violacea DSS12]|uniref:tRNA1(Val) (adenine(37)-N6)-methyltransferase n=2 Tax=Shewanella violacea TaxID=60217 RepID=D4ZG99_SHEVD|nr:conserved hypothetical protein [Shewanella violacea DSS12]